MQDAVLAAEDARFYEHSGVDYKGVMRAGLANFSEPRSQGASTITMQVARNFYLSTEKTFTRKIYEMLLALKIESLLTKDQILEVYMNQIYLGQRAYGFAAASEIYFGKPLKDITRRRGGDAGRAAQGAVGVQPDRQPEARDRAASTTSSTACSRTASSPPSSATRRAEQALRYRTPPEVPVHAEYVAETARQLIFSQYGDEAYTRGLNVYADARLAAEQTVAYRALRKGIMDYERRQVYRGPEAYVDLPADPKELDARIADALADHPDNDELQGGVVLEARPEEGRRGAAERRGDHDHRRGPEAGDLGRWPRRPTRRRRSAAAR